MKRHGFSLMEVVMVMAIIGMMAAVAAPRYANSVARYRVDLAAKRIAADMALAQQRAQIVSGSRAVAFAVSTSSYQLPGVPDLKKPAIDYSVKLEQGPYRAQIISANFGGDAEVVFNGYGVPDSGGSIVISSGSVQRTITLNATTGGVTIQ